MGCSFRPIPSNNVSDLKVRWYLEGSKPLDVYVTEKNVVSEEYQGRAVLLTKELKEGRARLQVSGVMSVPVNVVTVYAFMLFVPWASVTQNLVFPVVM